MRFCKLAALILALCLSASAATFRTSAAGGSTTGTSNRTVTITPAVNDLFVVFCAVAANSNDTPTMTDNNGSGTYDRIRTQNWVISAVNYRISVFVRTALVPNTTSTVITCTTGSNTSGSVAVVAVSGMTRVGANAVLQSGGQNDQAASTTPAPAFGAAATTTNMVLGAIGNGTNPAGMTAPASWTERQDVGFSSDTLGHEVATRDSGETGTTITWGSTSASKFASIIVELDTTDVACINSLLLLGIGCN